MRVYLKNLIKRRFHKHLNNLNLNEYSNPRYKTHNERAVEFAFLFKHLAIFYPKYYLDVGTGTTALPHVISNCGIQTTAIDNITDYWKKYHFNRHYHVIDDNILNPKTQGPFDFISCISVLEHIDQFDLAVENMVKLLNNKGVLILTFPYNENHYVDNVYKLEGSLGTSSFNFRAHVFSRIQIDYWINKFNLKLLDQEYWKFYQGEFWRIGSIIIPPKKTNNIGSHQLTCIAFTKSN